jgi:hypothetical protein
MSKFTWSSVSQVSLKLGLPSLPNLHGGSVSKSGKCPKLLAEPAERSFHKHNEVDVLGSVSSVSLALRTVGRFVSP